MEQQDAGPRETPRDGRLSLMPNSPRAGQPAQPRTSSTSPQLVTAYYDRRARPGRPRRSRSSSAPRATAARASTPRSTRRTSWPPPRPSASTGAAQGYDGPLFIGRDTHGLSEPAWATRARGARRQRRHRAGRRRRRLHARRPRSATRSSRANRGRRRSGPGRRHRRHARRTTRPATAASSTTRRTAARPTPTPPAGSPTAPTSCCARSSTASGGVPFARARAAARRYDFLGDLRRRPAERRRPRRDPGRRACGSAPTRWAARASTTGPRSPSGTGST